MVDRTPRPLVTRALLALTLAYVLILQGLFATATASTQIAGAIDATGITRTLCSGALSPGEAVPDDNGHHGAAQSSCCSWGAATAIDPSAPPSAATAPFPYRVQTSCPVEFGQVNQRAILFRVATTQGSRAPPRFAA